MVKDELIIFSMWCLVKNKHHNTHTYAHTHFACHGNTHKSTHTHSHTQREIHKSTLQIVFSQPWNEIHVFCFNLRSVVSVPKHCLNSKLYEEKNGNIKQHHKREQKKRNKNKSNNKSALLVFNTLNSYKCQKQKCNVHPHHHHDECYLFAIQFRWIREHRGRTESGRQKDIVETNHKFSTRLRKTLPTFIA